MLLSWLGDADVGRALDSPPICVGNVREAREPSLSAPQSLGVTGLERKLVKIGLAGSEDAAQFMVLIHQALGLISSIA